MKKDRDKHQESPDQKLPPEVSNTVSSEISSSLEAMKDAHHLQEEITKEDWDEKKEIVKKKEKSMFKGFYQKIVKGKGPNPILKKSKSIGGVRGKFHPSKKGKS
jgi:hypothetical protein